MHYFHLAVYEINAGDLLEIKWKKRRESAEPMSITIDLKSSVVPETACGLAGVFDCGRWKREE